MSSTEHSFLELLWSALVCFGRQWLMRACSPSQISSGGQGLGSSCCQHARACKATQHVNCKGSPCTDTASLLSRQFGIEEADTGEQLIMSG